MTVVSLVLDFAPSLELDFVESLAPCFPELLEFDFSNSLAETVGLAGAFDSWAENKGAGTHRERLRRLLAPEY